VLAHRPRACTDPPNQSGVSILGDIVPETSPSRHGYNEPRYGGGGLTTLTRPFVKK